MEITTSGAEPGVITLTGRFDANESDGFGAVVDRVKAEGNNDLSVDLAAVDFIDSTALASLVALAKWAKSNGHAFEIRNPSDPVRVILEITAIDKALDVVHLPVRTS